MKLLSVFAFISILACGEAEPDSELLIDNALPLTVLSITDSIGIDIGDADYVFGAIQSAGYNSDGEITVLDRTSCDVKIYSPSGNFLRRVSRHGEGPGELLNPLAMCLWPGARISVFDPMHGGISGFANSGEYIENELEITRSGHLNTIAVGDSEFVAVKNTISYDGDIGSITIFIGLFPMTIEPKVIYWQKELPLDPMLIGDQFLEFYLYTSWTADPVSGNVYISLFNECEYEILCFTPSGELFNTLKIQMEAVEKTEGEIMQEINYVTALLTALEGEEPQFNVECHPYGYRIPISELCVDKVGNIWARRGTTDEPFFDIWSSDGEMIGQAIVEGAGPESRSWNFIIDKGGILAYDENPESYQQIFILE